MKTGNRYRALIVGVAMLCLLLAGTSTNAAESTSVQPRLTAVSAIGAELDVTSSGRADCYSEVELRNGYTGDLTMVLQRSTNQIIWSDVKTWTASGSGTIEMDKSYYVASGYYYRVVATVDTYNAAGSFVETVSSNSQICNY